MTDLKEFIRDVPDFPKKGIIFKDITPLLGNAGALASAIAAMTKPFEGKGVEVVAAIESRGFIFGSLVAQRLGAGFAPIRKLGKLPYKTIRASYELEYGADTVEIHADAVRPGQKVLLVDDLLATGGTMSAACQLIKKLGGQIVGAAFMIELSFLPGRQKLDGTLVHSLIQYGSE